MRLLSGMVSRRRFLASASAAGVGLAVSRTLVAGDAPPALGGEVTAAAAVDPAADPDKALIAITMDLEMMMHYPQWGYMEWNYVKGNLDEPTKQYAVEACRRIKAKGGVAHCFALGRTMEQENVDWLKEIIHAGHRVGNHTYDHVNVWATKPEDVQYRSQRSPWLIAGKSAEQVIRENIQLAETALKARLGVPPNGFRTPGGHSEGLIGRADLQAMFLELGYPWVSSMAKYVPVKLVNPDDADFQAIAEAQQASQPFAYPNGLIEIPMSPLGDVASFRRNEEKEKLQKWRIDDFLKMLERSLQWTIEHRAVFDLLSHPAIMQWEDPKFRTYELICDIVSQSGGKAAVVGLDTIARRLRLRQASRKHPTV